MRKPVAALVGKPRPTRSTARATVPRWCSTWRLVEVHVAAQPGDNADDRDRDEHRRNAEQEHEPVGVNADVRIGAARNAERKQGRSRDRTDDCEHRSRSRDESDTHSCHREPLRPSRAQAEQCRLVNSREGKLPAEHDGNRGDAGERRDRREDEEHDGQHVNRVVGAGVVDAQALEFEVLKAAEDRLGPLRHRADRGWRGRADSHREAVERANFVAVLGVECGRQHDDTAGGAALAEIERAADDPDDAQMQIRPGRRLELVRREHARDLGGRP